MTRTKKVTFAILAATALLGTACEDRSKSVLDRDEGTLEETREAVDRRADDVKKDSK